jgi:hypothetical protein
MNAREARARIDRLEKLGTAVTVASASFSLRMGTMGMGPTPAWVGDVTSRGGSMLAMWQGETFVEVLDALERQLAGLLKSELADTTTRIQEALDAAAREREATP